MKIKQLDRRHFIIISLFILLLGATLLNWVLFKQAETYYTQLNATRLSPLSLHAFTDDSEPSTSLGDRTTVTLFGDSRAAQWPTQNNAQFTFINRGIGAQTAVQVAQRYEAHVAPTQPDILLVQVGINDLKTIGLFPDDETLIIAQVKQNIDTIVQEATADGTLVILTTIFPVGEPPLARQLFWSSSTEQAIIEVNDHLKTLANKDVIIFDTYELLVDENGRLNEAYAADELHLNQAGYFLLNQQLSELLFTLTTAK